MQDEHEHVQPPGARVLFVDDEPDIITALEAAFKLYRVPFRRTYAMSGIGAIERVRTACFCLCFLDIDLPDLTGAAAYQIRKIDPGLPIILFSNHSPEVAEPIIAQVPDAAFMPKSEWIGKPHEFIAEIVRLIGDKKCGQRCDEPGFHSIERTGGASHDRTIPKSLPLPEDLEGSARRFLAARGRHV